MKYGNPSFTSASTSGAITSGSTGAVVSVSPTVAALRAWQPSTWAHAPRSVDADFIKLLATIFKESMLDELDNVINDAIAVNGSLEHRGHVVAIALMCALDAISSYGYGRRCGRQIPPFVEAHFPAQYHPFAEEIKKLYRNNLVHSWNLFPVAILPSSEPIQKSHGVLSFGLLDFRDALRASVQDYLKKLETDADLQQRTLERYRALRATAKA